VAKQYILPNDCLKRHWIQLSDHCAVVLYCDLSIIRGIDCTLM